MENTKKSNDLMVLGGVILVLAIVNGILLATGHLNMDSNGIGIMIGSGLTIAIFSFLYKDNPLFKLAEHLYVGAAAAYLFHIVWYDNMLRDVIQPLFKPEAGMDRNYWVIIPSILGLLMLCRLSRKLETFSRISFAFVVGFAAGQAIPNTIAAWIIAQIGPTIQPLFTDTGFAFNAFIIIVGVICVLFYFFFSLEHKGFVGGMSKVGIWFIMVSFGASFGYTVMARMSLLIGRIDYLFKDWIPLISG